jgi:hypothetical protein
MHHGAGCDAARLAGGLSRATRRCRRGRGATPRGAGAGAGFVIADYMATLHYRHDADREHHLAGLVQAAFPA